MATDPSGRRWYLVSGVGWRKAYLFDEQWQLKHTFADPTEASLGDAGFVAVGDPGELQVLLGYWDGCGLRAFAPDGKGLWVNRHLDHLLQIAPGPSADGNPANLWATSTRGSLLQLTATGQSIQETAVIGRSIVQLAREASADLNSPPVQCGLSQDAPGQVSVVRFDEEGKVVWDYSLPSGEYASQFCRIQLFRNPSGEESWLAAGPDGSLHWLSDRGELVDRFDVGHPLAGFAAWVAEGSGMLLLATPESVTAWEVR
jgi:hypothetical protein